MDPADFDALLALHGARLYVCDIQDHLMVVHTATRRVVFVSRADLRPENAPGFARIASAMRGPHIDECRSHPWKPIQ